MASKRQKRQRKIEAAKVTFKLGDVYQIQEEMCIVKFVSIGRAWLSPVCSDMEDHRYAFLADRKLDEFGRTPEGVLAPKYTGASLAV